MENPIIVTEPTILKFYNENPHLDFVTMNLIFVEMLKNLSTGLSSTSNSAITSKILSLVVDIDKNLSSIKTDIIMNFTAFNERLNQTKKDYIDDLKTQLTNNILSNNEKISSLIDKNAETILMKTTSIINEIVPKSQDKNYTQIENCIKSFCSLIEQDTKKLLEVKNKDENASKIIIENIDNNFSKMVSNIQAPIFNLIQTSEERTSNGIQKVKDEFIEQKIIQAKLVGELHNFLDKQQNNSSFKGNVSENKLYTILQTLFYGDEIINVSTDTACCDFKVNRKDKNKPTILFENKEYFATVPTKEVNKFERDLQLQKNHGIFMSQTSPITFKDNFQIDIINGYIHVYIPSCNYDNDKIKIAVDMVDSLSSKLELISNSNTEDIYSTSKTDMDDLAEEYRNFAMQKASIQDMMKTTNKQLIDKLEEFQLPKIKSVLVKFGICENENLKCTFCNWEGKNKASLSAHLRNCKSNPKNVTVCEQIASPGINNVNISQQIDIQFVDEPDKKKMKK
jgi:hypothetical protein